MRITAYTLAACGCLISALLIPALILSSCGKACDEGENVSSQVVVESATLMNDSSGDRRLQGTVSNNADIEAYVELTFRAFEASGRRRRDPIAGIFGTLRVPAHSRARYSTYAISRGGSNPATFLRCSEIARFELVSVKATEKACGPRIGLP